MITIYKYLGDRLTDPALKGQLCLPVYNSKSKCRRGRNGNMLVEFGSGYHVVIARLLRKIKFPDLNLND